MPDRGINFRDLNKYKERDEISENALVLRDFAGVNLSGVREGMADNQFWWLEELIPVASGALTPLLGPGAAYFSVPTENGAPSFIYTFSDNDIVYMLAVWKNSGNAWITKVQAGATPLKITGLNGLLTSGQTSAIYYPPTLANNADGLLLIVDPAGYWSYDITTSTFSNQSGTLYGIAVTTSNPASLKIAAGATVPLIRPADNDLISGAAGGAVAFSASATGASLTAAGTGYQVGDQIQISGGNLQNNASAPSNQNNQPTVISVTTVGSGGVITGFSITNPGYYVQTPANAASVTGGSGTGATFTLSWILGNPFIEQVGYNYVEPFIQEFNGTSWVAFPALDIQTSGQLSGTAIAVYAGRVWIANGKRTLSYTDVDTYNSFGGSGGFFTITDSSFIGDITALYATNNFLYITSPSSINILSNVTVVNGIAAFSNINITSSIGTTQPNSLFSYYRGLIFASASGFYAISGSTPQSISDELYEFISSLSSNFTIWGCPVTLHNIVCVAFLVNFTDSFSTETPFQRTIIALMFKNKWFFSSQLTSSGGMITVMDSYPINGVQNIFGWNGNTLYPLFNQTNINNWLLRTKFWDADSPLQDKDSIDTAMGADFLGGTTPGITFNVDNELTTSVTTLGVKFPVVSWINNAGQPVTWINDFNQTVTWTLSPYGYQLLRALSPTGGGKYIGLTVTGTATEVSKIRLLALTLEKGAPM